MSKLTISSRERDFIAAVGLCADKTVVSLARFLKIPTHQLHYLIRKLTEEDIIRKWWVIDTYALGLTRYNVFFSIGSGDIKKRNQVVKEIGTSPHTVYIAEVGGDFDYELSMVARRPGEVSEFLSKFNQSYGDIMRVRLVSTRLSMIHFPRKYLSKKAPLCSSISIGNRSDTVAIDDFDTQIIGTLSGNPMWSNRDISHHLGRPESSVDLRMKRLVKEGVIKGALWSTNASRYGSQTFRLLIQTRGLSVRRREEIILFASNHPQVTTFVEGFGQWDLELVAEVAEYRQLSQLRETLYEQFGDVILDIRLLNRFFVHRYQSFTAV